MVIAPILGALLSLVLPGKFSSDITKIISGAVLALAIISLYIASTSGLSALSVSFAYINSLNVGFGLSVTQITMLLVVMTSVIFFAASFVGNYFIGRNDTFYNFIFLIIEASTLGVFLSSNLFLFFLFWEISEVGMFFIIFLYGGIDRKYASMKFIIYSIFSSLLLLIGIMLLYFYSAPHTFSISSLQSSAINMPHGIEALTFILLLVGFMVKVPIFPLHGWLPDAHTQAPAPGSMILAGVLLKFGGYGLILTFAIMHSIASSYAIYLAILFAFSSIYGAIVAIRKKNLKRMVAFTSIADMGIIAFALIAMNHLGTIGGTYAMVSHGFAISLLFMLAGMFDKEYGTLQIIKITGVEKWSSKAAYFFVFAVFAAIGIPLTAGFIGDVLLFMGTTGTFGIFGIVPAISIIIVGAYLFWVIERSIFSEQKDADQQNGYMDSTVVAAAAILTVATIVVGILPFIFSNLRL